MNRYKLFQITTVKERFNKSRQVISNYDRMIVTD
jgi:hypothetical protein